MDWKAVIDELIKYLVEDWEDYTLSFADGFGLVESFARSKDISLDYDETRKRWIEQNKI